MRRARAGMRMRAASHACQPCDDGPCRLGPVLVRVAGSYLHAKGDQQLVGVVVTVDAATGAPGQWLGALASVTCHGDLPSVQPCMYPYDSL